MTEKLIRKSRIALAVLIAACFGCVAANAETQELDGIAVIVNDEVVTLSEVNTRYENFLRQAGESGVTDLPAKSVVIEQILERLILESVQLQEAALRGIVVEDEELTESVRLYAQQNDMEIDEFREALEEQGISYLAFRDDVRRQMLLQRVQQTLVNRRIYISEQDIRDFRNSPFFELMASDRYRVGHILIKVDGVSDQEAEAEAVEVVKQLREGTDFATMAVNHSDASTALEGGDLGWRQAEEIPSLFAETVLEMEVGETSNPIRNALGFHVVQLVEKAGASQSQSEQVLVRHILVVPSAIKTNEEAEEEITEVRRQLLDGADFAELAKEYSEDPGTALAGGELGWTDGANIDPSFALEMFATPVGEISEAFESAFGWHVLEVMDRRVKDLSEEALDDLALRALHQRQFEEARQEWLKEIRDEAFVKIVQNPG